MALPLIYMRYIYTKTVNYEFAVQFSILRKLLDFLKSFYIFVHSVVFTFPGVSVPRTAYIFGYV